MILGSFCATLLGSPTRPSSIPANPGSMSMSGVPGNRPTYRRTGDKLATRNCVYMTSSSPRLAEQASGPGVSLAFVIVSAGEHAITLDHSVRILEQMLDIYRPKVPLA